MNRWMVSDLRLDRRLVLQSFYDGTGSNQFVFNILCNCEMVEKNFALGNLVRFLHIAIGMYALGHQLYLGRVADRFRISVVCTDSRV